VSDAQAGTVARPVDAATGPVGEQQPPPSGRVEVARAVDGRGVLVPRAVVLATAWSWRLLVIGAALYVFVFLVLARTQVVTTPLLLAVLVSALLHPLYRLVRRLRVPSVLAAILTILAFLLVIGGVLYLVGREVVAGVAEVASQASLGLQDLLSRAESIPGVDQGMVDDAISQVRDQVGSAGGQLATGALSVTSTATTVVTGVLLALFASIFFLADGPRIWRFLTALVPREGREPVRQAGLRAWVAVGAYVRAIPLVALVDAVLIGGGAAVIGIPLALPIGVVTFLAAFVPIVGAVVAGVLAVLVALVSNGLTAALIMLAIILLVQQLDGNVLQPLVLGRALDLHPLAVVLATSVGILLAGVPGGVLAVPVLAAAYVAVLSVRRGDAVEFQRARRRVRGSTPARVDGPGGLADGT
jgi:predicted PurR-regulated permease PerM